MPQQRKKQESERLKGGTDVPDCSMTVGCLCWHSNTDNKIIEEVIFHLLFCIGIRSKSQRNKL